MQQDKDRSTPGSNPETRQIEQSMPDVPPDLMELELLAARMAEALSTLDCPDCCGPVHEFIEFGAELHTEELEWACLVHVVRTCKRNP